MEHTSPSCASWEVSSCQAEQERSPSILTRCAEQSSKNQIIEEVTYQLSRRIPHVARTGTHTGTRLGRRSRFLLIETANGKQARKASCLQENSLPCSSFTPIFF